MLNDRDVTMIETTASACLLIMIIHVVNNFDGSEN